MNRFLSPWRDTDDKDESTPVAEDVTPNPLKPLSHSDDDEGDDVSGAEASQSVEPPVGQQYIRLTLEEYQKLFTGKSITSSSKVERRTKDLAKIEYSKLVVLSHTNFFQFKESIKVLGYSRKWMKKYSQPTKKQLKEVIWNKVDTDSEDCQVRREAFLVLYQLIPMSLKYLVTNVTEGDVMEVWRVLFQRFYQTSTLAVKAMKKEWESLSQGSKKVDEFVSEVLEKASNLRMVGVNVSIEEEATALLVGLNVEFKWLQQHFSLQGSAYTFDDVKTEALRVASENSSLTRTDKYAAEKKEVDKTTKKKKGICFDFNSPTGCSRKNCGFAHVKSKLKAKALVAKDKKKKLKDVANAVKDAKRFCFKCGDPNHIANECPHKDKIGEYARKLREGTVAQVTSFTLPCFMSRSSNRDSRWIMDSGSSQHITNSFDDLIASTCVPRGQMIFTVGNDEVMIPTHVGMVKFGAVVLTDVYFCVSCPVCLVSESRLVEDGASIMKKAESKTCLVAKEGVTLFEANLEDRLFVVKRYYNGKGMSSFC